MELGTKIESLEQIMLMGVKMLFPIAEIELISLLKSIREFIIFKIHSKNLRSFLQSLNS